MARQGVAGQGKARVPTAQTFSKGARMFTKRDEKADKAANALADVLRVSPVGAIIDWTQASQIAAGSGVDDMLDGPKLTARGVRIVNKARRIVLNDSGPLAWIVPGVGLKILTEQERLRIPAKHRQKKARRQMTFALRETKGIDVSQLSEHERRLYAAQMDSLHATRNKIMHDARLTKALAGDTQ